MASYTDAPFVLFYPEPYTADAQDPWAAALLRALLRAHNMFYRLLVDRAMELLISLRSED